MKIHFNPKDFLRQFKIAASVATVKVVRPVLCNVKIIADKRDGVVLMATDTEIGIHIRVDCDVSKDGEALLPPKQFRQILESAKDGRLTLVSTKNGILVTGERNGNEQWGLDTQSPKEFPDVADFVESAYHEIPAKSLSEMIRRTMFAVDKDNPHYALGGVCLEPDSSAMTAVSTDGRRLAVQNVDGIRVNGHEFEPAIVPVNTLKLLTKVLKEQPACDDDVKMAIHTVVNKEGHTSGTVHFQCGDVTIFSRLLEGRFPKWRSIIPKTDDRLHAKVHCETLRTALDRMVTTKLEPGVLFTFRRGGLTLESRAKESGQSKATIPAASSDKAGFVLDVTFMKDYLRAVGTAIIGIVAYNEPTNLLRMVFLFTLIVSIVGLKMSH
jgi:DNA polymerase-3 subunit beta